MVGYIYLLQCSDFVTDDLDIYTVTIKKSKYEPNDGTNIIYERICHNPQLCYNLIIELFKDKYIQAINISPNFFYGNYRRMVKDIENIIKSFIKDDNFIKALDDYIIEQLNNPYKAEIFNRYGIDTNKKLI